MFSNFCYDLLDLSNIRLILCQTLRSVNRSISWRRDINVIQRGHRKGVYQCRTIAILSERGSNNLARRKAENSPMCAEWKREMGYFSRIEGWGPMRGEEGGYRDASVNPLIIPPG